MSITVDIRSATDGEILQLEVVNTGAPKYRYADDNEDTCEYDVIFRGRRFRRVVRHDRTKSVAVLVSKALQFAVMRGFV